MMVFIKVAGPDHSLRFLWGHPLGWLTWGGGPGKCFTQYLLIYFGICLNKCNIADGSGMSYQILGKTLPLQYVYLIIILQSTKMVASFFFLFKATAKVTQ